MSLQEHLLELTAKSQIACKKCHAIADITFNTSSVSLVCSGCNETLGEWATTPQSIADITAFVAGVKRG
jgi:hypothetical protein